MVIAPVGLMVIIATETNSRSDSNLWCGVAGSH